MKSPKNNQLYRLCVAQFLETVREPEVLFWGMVFPILISIGLGLAFTQASEVKFRVKVVSENATRLDSLLRTHAVSGKNEKTFIWKIEDKTLGNTVFTFEYSDWHDAIIALKRGEADLIAGDSAMRLRYYFDPLNSQAQLAYTRLKTLVHAPAGMTAETLQANDISPLTLKGVRYIDFLVPGLIAFGIMADILWGISYTIIERRSQKLLRRMVATPMRKTNLLVSMMFVRILMNLVDAVIITIAMWLIFGVQVQGSLGALAVLFLAGNVAFTGIAVLISSRTSRTEVGNGWINAIQMPMLILSGIFFSYHNFPEWSLGAIRLLPLTALADGFRSIFNEGAGWIDILMPSATLTLVGMICFAIGMKLFKWY
ncbi:MAG: ABC transporter permease [Tannerella sp.]|jgi:ABC-type multidrug transport system permease subunit|nr:ABC transporter permease [Tannerella sp.]